MDVEELEEMDASEISPRRINAKEVLITQKDDEFIFPVADGTAKLSERDYEFRDYEFREYEFREATPKAGTNRKGRRSQQRTSGRIGRVSTGRMQQMTLKPVPISGRCKVTSSVVITMNFKFNSTCRRKKHSLFH